MAELVVAGVYPTEGSDSSPPALPSTRSELQALPDEAVAVLAVTHAVAFEELHARYRPMAQSMARSSAARLPRLDSADLMALALTRLWRSLPAYDPGRRFAPWAGVVMARAITTAASAALTAKSTFNWYAMLQRDDDPGGSGDVLGMVHDPDGAADAPVLLTEEEATVATLLDAVLSGREAAVLRLRTAGWSHADIAARYGITTKAVDNALRRGRDKLRESLSLDLPLTLPPTDDPAPDVPAVSSSEGSR